MKITIAGTASIGFICSYFLELTMANAEQYLAVAAVLLLDGFFGIIAGIKINSNLGDNPYSYIND